MEIVFNALFKIDIQDKEALSVPLPERTEDLKSYIIDLLDKIIANPDKKGFEFESETTEIRSLINKILVVEDHDIDKYNEYCLTIANRLHRKEIESDRRNNLQVDLIKGIAVISLVKFDNNIRKLIISKSDYNEFLDVQSYNRRQGFPIKKKIYKAFVAEINEDNEIIKVAVYDTNSVFTVYWYRDFLELKQVHTDEYNTDKVFNIIETKILTPIKKVSKRDYIDLWNATVRYFRIKPEFSLDGFVGEIFTGHVPFDDRVDTKDLASKTRKQFEKGGFDSQFGIVAKIISKRFKKSISLTPQIDLNLKEGIQNLKGTIQRFKEGNGNKWIMIRTDEGFEYFNDTEILNNE
ncbi:hypothetical protein [Chitinophaga caseinilytica]|uniref:hypothetical protein n=1 Tax=Chitinophaga caseinilytica TaxID=2267521 RepID=UPI003C2DE765